MVLDLSKFAGAPQVDQKDAKTSADEIVQRYPEHLRGKTVLVTGVSPGGVGAGTVLSLATGEPKLLILSGRSASKVEQTANEVKQVNRNVEVRVLLLDLNSLSSVTTAAKSLSDLDHIDIIINNAGIMAHPYVKTVDGVESQFAANYLGHFQLTRVLLPQLQASPGGGVVVNVVSVGHRLGKVNFDDLGFVNEAKYDKWEAYGHAKSAEILHIVELNRRGLVRKALAVHPGNVATHLMPQNAVEDIMAAYGPIENAVADIKTPKQGASTSVWAALNPDLSGFHYLEDCQISKAADHATDLSYAEKLWSMTEKLIDSLPYIKDISG